MRTRGEVFHGGYVVQRHLLRQLEGFAPRDLLAGYPEGDLQDIGRACRALTRVLDRCRARLMGINGGQCMRGWVPLLQPCRTP